MISKSEKVFGKNLHYFLPKKSNLNNQLTVYYFVNEFL